MRWRVDLRVRYRHRTNLALAALALAALSAGLIGSLAWRPHQAVASPTQAGNPIRLQYYLTKTGYVGDQALTACAPGYHMASLWEIADTSNLRYNRTLGVTRMDSGHGPPTDTGWIRTGSGSGFLGSPGTANCRAWTSSAWGDIGSYLFLPNNWTTNDEDILGWAVAVARCSVARSVWCVGVSITYLPIIVRNYSG